jgi:hypothetical protein
MADVIYKHASSQANMLCSLDSLRGDSPLAQVVDHGICMSQGSRVQIPKEAKPVYAPYNGVLMKFQLPRRKTHTHCWSAASLNTHGAEGQPAHSR